MDKRFFLALFLSLIVIAVTQLVFPSAEPAPTARNAKDSTAHTASSTLSGPSATAASTPTATPTRSDSAGTSPSKVAVVDTAVVVAETTVVETPKATYRF